MCFWAVFGLACGSVGSACDWKVTRLNSSRQNDVTSGPLGGALNPQFLQGLPGPVFSEVYPALDKIIC